MNLSTNKLLLAMANACMSITELAEQSGLSRPSLTKFTTGKTNPKPATIGKIAKALNVRVEELIVFDEKE